MWNWVNADWEAAARAGDPNGLTESERPDTGGLTDLLGRDSTAETPNLRWVADIERHEAFFESAG